MTQLHGEFPLGRNGVEETPSSVQLFQTLRQVKTKNNTPTFICQLHGRSEFTKITCFKFFRDVEHVAENIRLCFSFHS